MCEDEFARRAGSVLAPGPPIAVIDLWRLVDGRIMAVAARSHTQALATVEGEEINVGAQGITAAAALAGLSPELDAMIEQEREDI
jgi:hypothetical protein